MKTAIVLAEGLFSTTDAKTAHGLVRYSKRYRIVGVIDSALAGLDAGEFLDGRPNDIKIYADLDEALFEHPEVEVLVIGVATAGGYLPEGYREIIKEAMLRGLSIVSGLHYFLSDDPELAELAETCGVEIVDVRKMFRDFKVPFTGKIDEVKSLKVAVLGTDSAVGKRTTAIMLTEALNEAGLKAVFVGTGQTAWMQGAEYGIVMDAMVNDFVAGGLEHEVYRAYVEKNPDVIVIPGQGALLHPAFPGGWEILATVRPEVVIIQHAPKRKFFDGFPGYEIPSLDRYLKIIELVTGRRVLGIALNHEGMGRGEVEEFVELYERKYGLPVCDPLIHGVGKFVKKIKNLLGGSKLARPKVFR